MTQRTSPARTDAVDWQACDHDGLGYFRGLCEGYIVFLRPDPPQGSKAWKRKTFGPGWFVHILMPEEERQKAFLAGPGFDHPVGLAEAKNIAWRVALEGRGKLERLAQRRQLESQAPKRRAQQKSEQQKQGKRR